MPRLDPNMKTNMTPNNYNFTATRLEALNASEYTLVTVICDVSSSVSRWRKSLEKCIKTVLSSCKAHPRGDYLMLRLCAFASNLKELHGFREVHAIDPDSYNKIIKTGGCTALYEASFAAIDASNSYARQLTGHGFTTNGIVFVITDGQDNHSNKSATDLGGLLDKIRGEELMAQLTTVLVGVTSANTISKYLMDLRDSAGFDAYLDLGGATRDSLARLAGLIGNGISQVSMSLSTGVPTPSLSF